MKDTLAAFNSIISATHEPMAALDADLRLIQASPSFYRDFNMTPEEAAGKIIYTLGGGCWDIPKLRKLLEDILPREAACSDFEIEHDFPSLGRRKLRLNASRTAQLTILAIKDVTERDQAQETLRASEERYRALTLGMPDYVFMLDLEGRVLYSNHRIAGMPEPTGKCQHELFPPDVARSHLEIIREVVATGKPSILEELVDWPGRQAWFENRILPLKDKDGRVTSLLGITRDITERKLAAEALRKQETFNRFILDSLPVGVAVNSADPKVEFTYANDSFLRHYRITRDALADPDKFWESVYESPEFRAEIRERVLADCASGDPARMRWDDIPITRKGEETTYVSARNVPIQENKLMLSIVWDVTERKRAEEALRESERFLNDVIENVPDMIFVKDAQYLRFVKFNKAGERLLGYPRESLLHKNDYDFFPRKEADFFTRVDREVLAKKQLCEIPEEKIQTAGNIERILHTKKIPILDDAGNPKYLLGISEDITARSKTESELRESEARFRLVVESAPEAIFVQSEGRFVYLNPAACRLFGAARAEDMLDKELMDRIAPQYHDKVQDRIRKQLETGRAAPLLELEYLRLDGSRIPVEATAVPINYLNRNAHMVFIRDITERKQAESALANMQKLESLGTLAGGIAHDFNNILTAIFGNLSLLQDQLPSGGETRELLQEAQSACGTAKSLSHQLLTFAKGGSPIVKVMDLRPLLKQTAGFAARGSNARCVFELGESPLAVRVDKEQIAQVFQNLMLNAVQAMPSGGQITIRAAAAVLREDERPPLAPGNYVRITVKDQGLGIPPEHISKIFDPYFSTKAAGRGLGLAMCYSIINKHGGHIYADSPPGGGAELTIHLPAVDAAETAIENAPPKLTRGSGSVLIMDDEPYVAKALKRMLERLGYQAESVPDGKAALDAYVRARAAGEPYDVIIMDLTIPGGMGGKDTMSQLAGLDPRAKAIVSSGYSNDPVMSDYSAYGFCGVLTKPYSMEEVSDAINRAIGCGKPPA